jgi:thiol-disulfide isomerase/thioredoxin
MNFMPTLKIGIIAVVFAQVLLCLLSLLAEGVARIDTLPGKEMELKGVLMDGTEFDLASLKGKIVYVYFWSTWCGPCVREMPLLHAKYLTLKDAGFEVVTYSIDDNLGALAAFQEKTKYTWKTISVLKSQEKGFRDYHRFYRDGVRRVPDTVLIGRDGKVIKTDVRGKQLTHELDKLLGDEMERKAFDPNTSAEFKLDFYIHRFFGINIFQEFSNEMYENVIAFIENNKDNQDRNMESLCSMLISNLNLNFRRQRSLAPEHQPLAVMKRLLPTLKESENSWLREYSQTLEETISELELPKGR